MNTYLKIDPNLQDVVLKKIYRERVKINHKELLKELLCTINCWAETDNKDSFFSDINEVLFSVNQNSSGLEEKKGQVNLKLSQ